MHSHSQASSGRVHVHVWPGYDGTAHACAQVTVLDVLDQEGALHLLPSMQKAPSVANHADGKGLYSKTKPPAEVLRIYRRLLEEGSLTKAAELGSLPYGMATKWA